MFVFVAPGDNIQTNISPTLMQTNKQNNNKVFPPFVEEYAEVFKKEIFAQVNCICSSTPEVSYCWHWTLAICNICITAQTNKK